MSIHIEIPANEGTNPVELEQKSQDLLSPAKNEPDPISTELECLNDEGEEVDNSGGIEGEADNPAQLNQSTIATALITTTLFPLLFNYPQFAFQMLKRCFSIFMMIFDICSDMKLSLELSDGLFYHPANASSNNSLLGMNTTRNESFRNTTRNESLNTTWNGREEEKEFHPFWFSVTTLFIYLPHLGPVFLSSLKSLIVRFILHRFKAINKWEKDNVELPALVQMMVNIDKFKYDLRSFTKTGILFILPIYLILIIIRLLFLIFMPILVVLRQTRQLNILVSLQKVRIQMGLIDKATDSEIWKKTDDENDQNNPKSTSDNIWSQLEKVIISQNFSTGKHNDSLNETRISILEDITVKNDDSGNGNGNDVDKNDELELKNCDDPREEKTEIETHKYSCPSLSNFCMKDSKKTRTRKNTIAYNTEQTRLLETLTKLSQERFREAFFESAPQATFQLYMWLAKGQEMSILRALSIASSLISLGLATVDYTEHKLKHHYWREEPTFFGNLLILLWRLPALAARCISIAVFGFFVRSQKNKYLLFLFLFFVLHMIVGIFLELCNLNGSKVRKWLKEGNFWQRMIKYTKLSVQLIECGWISLFTLLEYRTDYYDENSGKWVDQDDPTVLELPSNFFKNLAFHNFLIFFENACLLAPWYVSTPVNSDDAAMKNRLMILMITLFASPFSLLSMFVFQILSISKEPFLKTAKEKCFKVSENFLELQFCLLKDSIRNADANEMRSLLDEYDNEQCKAISKMTDDEGSIKKYFLKSQPNDLLQLTKFLEVGVLLTQRGLVEESTWLIKWLLDFLFNNPNLYADTTISDKFKFAKSWANHFCFAPEYLGDVGEVLNAEVTEAEKVFSINLFLFVLCSTEENLFIPSNQWDKLTFLEKIKMLNSSKFHFNYHNGILWKQMKVDPLVINMIKMGLNFIGKDRPSLHQMSISPGMFSIQDKTDFLYACNDPMNSVYKDGEDTDEDRLKKKDTMRKFLDNYNAAVTGNDFTLMKDPISQETMQEKLSPDRLDKITQKDYDTGTIVDACRFIRNDLAHEGGDLCMYETLLPNFIAALMKFICKFQNDKLFASPMNVLSKRFQGDQYWYNKFEDMDLVDVAIVGNLSMEEQKNNDEERKEKLVRNTSNNIGKAVVSLRSLTQPSKEEYEKIRSQMQGKEQIVNAQTESLTFLTTISEENIKSNIQNAYVFHYSEEQVIEFIFYCIEEDKKRISDAIISAETDVQQLQIQLKPHLRYFKINKTLQFITHAANNLDGDQAEKNLEKKENDAELTKVGGNGKTAAYCQKCIKKLEIKYHSKSAWVYIDGFGNIHKMRAEKMHRKKCREKKERRDRNRGYRL